ncbi:hypothetical protein J1614_002839 [Plenodomus biglobosus]|nr:hypothetical protein J1614_002839 [Plenodomus biglobosus]
MYEEPTIGLENGGWRLGVGVQYGMVLNFNGIKVEWKYLPSKMMSWICPIDTDSDIVNHRECRIACHAMTHHNNENSESLDQTMQQHITNMICKDLIPHSSFRKTAHAIAFCQHHANGHCHFRT